MKKTCVTLIPYAAVLAADFYLLPLLARDTGSAMFLTIVVMPVTAFAAALAHGMRRGFSPLLPVLAFLLFLPSVPIYYNASAWHFPAVFAVVVLAGNGLGNIAHGRR